ISSIDGAGQVRDLITGLPGQGDHQTNQIVFKDGLMYFGVGTVTNSAVVGHDNAVFGWLSRRNTALHGLHDVPCQDVTLTGQSFESRNELGDEPSTVRTSPYSALGAVVAPGGTVKGSPKCNGAVLRARPDGSGLEVYAWGFRNPYGLETGPDGSLYVTMHGFDARGSRPVENAWDCFYRVQQGAWYGWPDFACDTPVTDARFHVKDKPRPAFLLARHPSESPPAPIARFDPHAATNGFAFSPSARWGPPTTAYIALFGDFTPATGTVDRPRGVKIVKVDAVSGRTSEFIANETPGQASRHSAGGLEHPSDVTFGPDGAMYIADWSIARVSEKGLVLKPDTGVIWKVTPGRSPGGFPGGPSLGYALIGTVALAGGTVAAGAGRSRTRRAADGLWTGALAGVVMGAFTMTVAAMALDLPWYAAPRVLATIVMGRTAVANILDFDVESFLVGTAVLVVLTALLGLVFAAAVRARARLRVLVAGLLFGLAGWALLQYFVLPALFPLVTEKGFPPHWYAVSFGVYGLVLGALMASRPLPEGVVAVARPSAAPTATAGGPSEAERWEQWRRRRGNRR
ncbi:MAG: PQQ-dependent sugar dehydrogenase, partial [Actinobacteria bacterium]|nr:PQQ-dependent sugar dehydrogenase [Actinomycetota bacterium]